MTIISLANAISPLITYVDDLYLQRVPTSSTSQLIKSNSIVLQTQLENVHTPVEEKRKDKTRGSYVTPKVE